MLTVEECIKLYPQDKNYLGYLSKNPRTIMSGMLKFNEDTAHGLAGAFEGNYGFFKLDDCSKDLNLESEESLTKKEIAFNKKHNITNKKRKNEFLHWAQSTCTIERPIKIYICGNDDTSYSKFFKTIEEAKAELELLIACEPLDLYKDVVDNDFVFTN